MCKKGLRLNIKKKRMSKGTATSLISDSEDTKMANSFCCLSLFTHSKGIISQEVCHMSEIAMKALQKDT